MAASIIILYRLVWRLIGLGLPFYLRARAAQGKEDLKRLGERYGYSMHKRPHGLVYWLHGASVGETVSSLTLAQAILDQQPSSSVLITSGTKTSAELAKQRIKGMTNRRVFHQYHPHDHPRWINRFLDHWQPDLVVMMESEIWPNMITLSAERGLPLAMASAQVSTQSMRRWRGLGRLMAKALFPKFNAILAIDADQKANFDQLVDNPENVLIGGSMKAAAAPLDDQPHLRQAITAAADGRPIILLASSHDGEETLFMEALEAINQSKNYWAVMAPRHPHRGNAIRDMITANDGVTGQRSKNEAPDAAMDYWIADAMGEMGGLIRAADVIVLGGGFAALGGHNPMEMAALGKGVISGQHIFKNNAAFDALDAEQAVIFADSAVEIADAINLLTTSSTRLDLLNKGAKRAAKKSQAFPRNSATALLSLVKPKPNERKIIERGGR